MHSFRRCLISTVATLVFTLATADGASAQWTFWSPGTPCSSGDTIRLDGIGPMSSPSTNTLIGIDGPPGDTCFLLIGFTSLRTPFFGGILGPSPDIVLPATFDSFGEWTLPFVWPAAVPAGTMLWYQIWCPDSALSPPWCSSNTLKSTST